MVRRAREEAISVCSSGRCPSSTPTERQNARSHKRPRTRGNNDEHTTPNEIQDVIGPKTPETTTIPRPTVEDGQPPEQNPPKSRKELRAERKAARKAAAAVAIEPTDPPVATNDDGPPVSEEARKAEKMRLRKERRVEALKERELEEKKERRDRNRLIKRRKLNREKNAPGGAGGKVGRRTGGGRQGIDGTEAKAKAPKSDGVHSSMEKRVLDDLFNGTHDDATGTTELRLGVRFIDVVVGDGPTVVDRALVTVRYKLTGGKFGAVIDSSNRFNFRIGKGEVIRGWDIGLMGMRQGGRRRLIVPPKAGYGSQDIGAGAGATLNFDITLLECRG